MDEVDWHRGRVGWALAHTLGSHLQGVPPGRKISPGQAIVTLAPWQRRLARNSGTSIAFLEFPQYAPFRHLESARFRRF